jgi:hypothetical protein
MDVQYKQCFTYYMCMYTYVCMYVCMYVCTYVCICMYVCVCVCMCVCVCVCVCVYRASASLGQTWRPCSPRPRRGTGEPQPRLRGLCVEHMGLCVEHRRGERHDDASWSIAASSIFLPLAIHLAARQVSDHPRAGGRQQPKQTNRLGPGEAHGSIEQSSDGEGVSARRRQAHHLHGAVCTNTNSYS